MNERIKELAEQVGITENNLSDGDMSHDDLKKFAELIIQECTGVVEGGRFLHDDAPAAVFAKECSRAIKRHFGIEEKNGG